LPRIRSTTSRALRGAMRANRHVDVYAMFNLVLPAGAKLR